MAIDQLDQLAQAWETVHQQQVWGQYPPEPLIRWVARTFKGQCQGLTVLEVGCGAGANVWYLAEQGFTVTGLDVSRTALHRAEQLLAKRGQTGQLVCGNLTELPFSPAQFDVLIDLGATVCVPDDMVTQCFSEYYRVLKPGGHYLACIAGNETAKLPATGSDQVRYVNGNRVANNVVDIANKVFSQAEIEQHLAQFTLNRVEQTLLSDRNQQDWVQLFWVHAQKP
jgi:ubiquinone/menaquinone biosynthesis C-methylase UbiE